ncbi:hypothetical protein HO173_011492 [Letharia columbiana]|uniref:Uncharacterized protein n=1 Tax=Letharia columbiana TaxID=112416 RepID=A0A8H6KZ92_9LECA|nr:uncharacterized protein HO173_011492 [Letharia columbiana]KAF6229637.1 hypothetical protein HO173_011492 [Letharia columbiana]
MSFSGASDEGTRATNSTDTNGPSSSTSPNSKVQTAWQSVKTNFKVKTSMPDLKRWLSSPRASESNSQGEERHPEDEEESLFGESLLGLMQQTGRFDYLDYNKDISEQDDERIVIAEKEKVKEKQKDLRRSLKRFSWSR